MTGTVGSVRLESEVLHFSTDLVATGRDQILSRTARQGAMATRPSAVAVTMVPSESTIAPVRHGPRSSP